MPRSRRAVFRFRESAITTRFEYLYYTCKQYIATCNPPSRVRVGFDPLVLYNVLIATYDDVARYKSFHLKDPWAGRSDAIKRAAYLTKWFVHLRPIYAVRPARPRAPTFDLNDDTILLNEAFAIGWSLTNLATDLGLPMVTLHHTAWHRLVYDLKYRDLTGNALIHIYQLISDLAARKEIIIF